MAGKGTPATAALDAAGVSYTLHTYRASSDGHYGAAAADALGVDPARMVKTLAVVLDRSVSGFATVYCSAGRRGLSVELAPGDLVAATGATLAGIATH